MLKVWTRFFVFIVITLVLFVVLTEQMQLPVDNNAVWLGLTILGHAFIVGGE